jgi:hypothetical protein
MDEMLASAERREQLHRLIAGLLDHGQEVLGRWADVMVNSGTASIAAARPASVRKPRDWLSVASARSEKTSRSVRSRNSTAVKDAYDPHNVFHLNHDITPSGARRFCSRPEGLQATREP